MSLSTSRGGRIYTLVLHTESEGRSESGEWAWGVGVDPSCSSVCNKTGSKKNSLIIKTGPSPVISKSPSAKFGGGPVDKPISLLLVYKIYRPSGWVEWA